MNEQLLKVACQTFTWEMLGDAGRRDPDILLSAIAGAGYSGIEITDTMIGRYADDPTGFSAALHSSGLSLSAMAFGSSSGFSEPERVSEDLASAERWIEFAARFPGAVVSIGSATQMSPGSREGKIALAADFYNQAAVIAHKAGVAVAVHPSSHHDTLLLSRADYEQLFSLLEPDLVGWVPDTGHILRGKQNLLGTLGTWQSRIRYVHLKDVDEQAQWAMLGKGVCEIQKVIDLVRDAPMFNGWLVVEEESADAAANPEQAVKTNRETLRRYSI